MLRAGEPVGQAEDQEAQVDALVEYFRVFIAGNDP